ncbi:hypothetical protein HPB52_008580 [Rhipicephalus sanguineus]|uniref:VOC domain-containing protein n=1 Tax=Rhipicephalus sanguineus TaxID=34632 RepID=A0A9D4T405_RHISA|nr:hypothetical protein HPB52_008580 [Rhipicephalus sanguineus]
MSGCLSDQEAEKCCSEPDPSTRGFIMQQTMYRIRDPKASLDFYTRVLGMRLLQKLDFPEMKFSLTSWDSRSRCLRPTPQERAEWAFGRKATIELTHNWEDHPEGGYHNGNTAPRGFGHIGIMVPTSQKRAPGLRSGVKFVKKLTKEK